MASLSVNFVGRKRNIKALLEKSFFSCLRNTSGSLIKSVAVKMPDMLEALRQVDDSLEEAWGNLVKDYFSSHALQVNYSNLRTSTPSQSLILCPRFSHPPCKPACPAGFCLADNTIQWRPFLLLKNVFSSGNLEFTALLLSFCWQTNIFVKR